MLLEFQGKPYNHREPGRDRYCQSQSPSQQLHGWSGCRFYQRYDLQDTSSGVRGGKRDR